MTKTAIFTIAINELDYFKYTLSTIAKYAEKTNSDLTVLGAGVINFRNIYFEKFYIEKLLDVYDRVLYVDADVIITPHAGNIFKLYPDENTFYAYHENDHNEIMDRDMFVRPLLNDGLKWGKLNGKYQYFNAGVMLVSKRQRTVFHNLRPFAHVPNIFDWNIDQTLLNYSVVKNDIQFQSLNNSFNRMFLGKEDNGNERYKADFIHYAGDEKCMNNNKLQTIKNDYKYFYHG